jgi:hypothetical protein
MAEKKKKLEEVKVDKKYEFSYTDKEGKPATVTIAAATPELAEAYFKNFTDPKAHGVYLQQKWSERQATKLTNK